MTSYGYQVKSKSYRILSTAIYLECGDKSARLCTKSVFPRNILATHAPLRLFVQGRSAHSKEASLKDVYAIPYGLLNLS